MPKTKYKLGQILQTETHFGHVTEVRISSESTSYELDNEALVNESEVKAVYRAVNARKPRELKEASRSRKEKKSA